MGMDCRNIAQVDDAVGVFMLINGLIIISGLFFGSVVLSAAKPKPLPVGSCIANKYLCNANDPNLDSWEVSCYTGAILKIEQVGKHSYKTSCIEKTLQCKEFVTFEAVKDKYFPIECPLK